MTDFYWRRPEPGPLTRMLTRTTRQHAGLYEGRWEPGGVRFVRLSNSDADSDADSDARGVRFVRLSMMTLVDSCGDGIWGRKL